MSLYPMAPGGAAGAAGGGAWDTSLIAASAWFDGTADYLSRTSAAANGLENWFCFYVKPSADGANRMIYHVTFTTSVREFRIRLDSNNHIEIYDQVGSNGNRFVSAEYFENFATWLPVIVQVDPANGTAADRIKVWALIEGVMTELTDSLTQRGVSGATSLDDVGIAHNIGRDAGGSEYFDGALAQLCRIDGSATYTDFFTTDANGWFLPKSDAQIKALADAAGGESFLLASALGDGTDASTGGNDWTPASMSQSANGSADTPSNNICHWNARTQQITGTFTVTEGGQRSTASATTNATGPSGTISFVTEDGDGFYFECTGADFLTGSGIGIIAADVSRGQLSNFLTPTNGDGYFLTARGAGGGNTWWYNDSVADTGVSWAATDVIGVLVRAGKIWFAINGTWVLSGDPETDANPIATGIAGWWLPYMQPASAGSIRINCGQVAYTYTPPSGAKSITAANVRASHSALAPELHHRCGTYSGTGAQQSITGLGFQPGLVMIDPVSGAQDMVWFDVVQGAGKYAKQAIAQAQQTDAQSLQSFDADGFTVGTSAVVNTNTTNYFYAAWTLEDPVADTSGDIESQVAISPTGAIAVVEYTAPASPAAGNTVGIGAARDAHPGRAPDAIIFQNLDLAADTKLYYHHAPFEIADPETDYIPVSNTGGLADDIGMMNDTAPTAARVTLGTNGNVQAANARHRMLLLWDVPGISRVAGYDGNSNTAGRGPYVDLRGRCNFMFERTTTGNRESMYCMGETVPQYGANGAAAPRYWHYGGESSSGSNTFATAARDGTGFWQEGNGTNNHNGSGQWHAFFAFLGRDNRQLFT